MSRREDQVTWDEGQFKHIAWHVRAVDDKLEKIESHLAFLRYAAIVCLFWYVAGAVMRWLFG